MEKRTNELKREGHDVSVWYDEDQKIFLKVDGIFYKVFIDEDEMEVIYMDEPCTPNGEVKEIPKEWQSKWIGH